jgi:hypothetical protein
MRRALLLVALGACGQIGVTVDVSAMSDVPPLDSLRVQVTQGDLLVEQSLPLNGKSLPQSFAIVSKGLTRGTVNVTVQGLSGTTVEAVGSVSADLKPASSAAPVSVVLARLCTGGVCGCAPRTCTSLSSACGRLDDGCGGAHDCGTCSTGDVCANNQCIPQSCTPKTCAQANAQCGQVPDGCGGHLECGSCDAGTCGGGGTANKCGLGQCTPATRCDAGMECGTISDGCSGVLSCGTCDAGACSASFQCGCMPKTSCPPNAECGQISDGCGAMLDCGTCDAGQICGGPGVGTPNRCACAPLTQCPPEACVDWPDGCGGHLNCQPGCSNGQSCTALGIDAGRECTCNGPKTACGSACVDLQTDSNNCGRCGNTCPGGQTCYGGLCPCVDAGSNADGHCCPPGWFFSATITSLAPRCFIGPFDAGTHAEAIATCQQVTLAGYGAAASAVGFGDSATATGGGVIPAGACGSYWRGNIDTRVEFTTSATTEAAGNNCIQPCMMGNCVCTTCNCTTNNLGCEQPFFCVLDPLGPYVEGPCNNSGQCPPGDLCAAGVCVDAGTAFCSAQADCTVDGGNRVCQYRGTNQSGLCQ